MQLALAMVIGLIVGSAVLLLTRKHSVAALSTALALGITGSALFLGTINRWFLPDLGRFGAIAVGLMSGVATAVAFGCVYRGERRPLNWVALAVSAPPLLFLVVFGIAELIGPSH